jgi:hypothetical protein
MGRGLKMILIKLIFTVLALIGIINPKLSWKISEGWKFKNAEPSSFYLGMTRVMSVVILIIVWFVLPLKP